MIVLAGIIVCNSIMLMMFIRQRLNEGMSLEDAVVRAVAARIKPVALTAASAVVGAYAMVNDPIFNGLAISMVFGLTVFTFLTVTVVPLSYHMALSPYCAVARQRWT